MRFRILFALVVSSSAVPFMAHAAIPFLGPIIPEAYNVCPASWGLLITVVNNIISFLITLAIVFVAPLMIAWAGFLYVVNPVDPSGMAKAKGILLNTLFGIVIALSGWMIVDAIMAVLYHPTGSVGSTWSTLITSGGVDPCLNVAGSLKQVDQATGSGSGVTVVTPNTSEQTLRQQFAQAGVAINHDPCPVGSNGQGCTNVAGMQSATVTQIIGLANACGRNCGVMITGGTEPGHAAGAYSHGNGFKVDLRPTPGLDSYIKGMTSAGTRTGDHPGPAYTDNCLNQYVQESDHWDITVKQACVPPR